LDEGHIPDRASGPEGFLAGCYPSVAVQAAAPDDLAMRVARSEMAVSVEESAFWLPTAVELAAQHWEHSVGPEHRPWGC
jgi:hypothetical protein